MLPIPYKKVLVTGGAGFIGSHLVDALAAGGCDVTVIDNLSTGSLSNLSRVRDRITFIEADIRDRDQMLRAAENTGAIFHQAAVVSVPETVEDPVGSADVNETGTLQVLDAARRQGVRRVVLASSCAVYGDGPELPKTESLPPRPSSPYAAQKRSNERYAELFHRLYGLETVCLRYFNVYGPRQNPSSPYSGVISIFMTRAVSKSPPVIYGDGGQNRDFVFVTDVVRANLLAAAGSQASGKVLNVGTEEAVPINRLWELISALAGFTASPRFLPARTGDIYASRASIERARAILGFTPVVALEQGLEKTFKWYSRL